MTAVNCFTNKLGTNVLNVVSVVKLLAVIAVIVCGGVYTFSVGMTHAQIATGFK